jgi:hypothetical protein
MIQPESFYHLGRFFRFYCFFAEGAFYISNDGFFALTNEKAEVMISERQTTDFQELQ